MAVFVGIGIGVNVGTTAVWVEVGIGVNVGGIGVSVSNNVAIVVGTGVLVKSGVSAGIRTVHVDKAKTIAMMQAVKAKRKYINAS